LCTVAAVRLRCLARNALVWAPSAQHPSLGDRRARARRPSEAVLHAEGRRHGHAPSGARVDLEAEATGALPPRASFKAVFVIEPLQGDLFRTVRPGRSRR
jgi:hypothetical protein